jgi:hypothetical protein|tara:strand:+ start:503 stop:841 length:339 start_codon:yes stop_codon:yes gene_type:complete
MENLKRDKWSEFFNRVSKELAQKRAEIEVQSLDIGDQIEAEYVQIRGVVFDHKDDLIEVILDGLDHLIRHPKEVQVKGNEENLEAILIVDGEGVRHLITLRDPLILPAPKTT